MAQIGVYFDGSGLGGTVGDEGLWADIVNWEGELPDDEYLTLHHLMERGWEDQLPELEADLESAIEEHSPSAEVANGLAELLNIIQDRADGDEAAAIALVEYGGEDEPAANDKKGKSLPSRGVAISPEKACKILKDGTVRGKPLTDRQRGLFGAICGRGRKKKTNNSQPGDARVILAAFRSALHTVLAGDGEVTNLHRDEELLPVVNSIASVDMEEVRNAIAAICGRVVVET